ncbi:hypothetical protein AVEN_88904-1 [Araneus ventricosus]|uniref:Uncharacterized protein n=1 Tax=Araneus ventricosus TaxID=182803 RepID=A0A4Y2M155_ARAVE|nr:hypothetical protein AVEN_88904-1 [Araneus ventricosus]
MSYLEANFCKPLSKKFAARERSKPVTAICLQVVVTGEMLPGRYLLEVLEQILVTKSKIETIGGVVNHLPAELRQQLL